MVVENAGFGAGAAAPIARRVFDYCCSGQYPSEADIAATQPGPVDGADRRAAADRRGVPLPRAATVDGAACRARRRRRATAPRRPGLAHARAAPRRASEAPCERRPMSAVFDRPSLWQRAAAGVHRLRRPAASWPSACWRVAGLVTMYSAGFDHGTRFVDHGAQHGARLRRAVPRGADPAAAADALAVPLYVVGLAAAGRDGAAGLRHHRKGATRWLNVGVTIQPSEILKIAMPLMLAWWFQRREGQLRALDFVIAGAAAAGAGRASSSSSPTSAPRSWCSRRACT